MRMAAGNDCYPGTTVKITDPTFWVECTCGYKNIHLIPVCVCPRCGNKATCKPITEK